MQTAVQLYTLRALDASLADQLSLVADAGFDGVEFAGLDGSIDRSTLDGAGVRAAGAHVPAEELGLAADGSTVEYRDRAGLVSRYRDLGARRLVVPYLDGAAFDGEGATRRTAESLDALAGSIPDAELCYHNHEFEFRPGSGSDSVGGAISERAPSTAGGDNARAVAPSTPWERLVAGTDRAGFELDVGWAHAAGADPVDLLSSHGERIPLVHLKDVAVDASAPRGARPVDLGAGDVDLAGVVDAAKTGGVEWLVFEHDDPTDPRASTARAGEVLATLL